MSAVLLIWGIKGDYPIRAENDELFYSAQVVEMIAWGKWEPNQTCNPASTLIYPLRFTYMLLDALVFHGKLFTKVGNVTDFYQDHIFWFCLVPRFAFVAITVLTIPVIFLIAEEAFSEANALMTIYAFALAPLVLEYGELIRSDVVALFFQCLTIYFCLRLMRTPTNRMRLATGVSAGLAIATRYFMLALLPVIGLGELVIWRQNKQSAGKLLSIFIAPTTAIITFLLTTPFFVLDFWKYLDDVRAETVLPLPGADGLSPVGNALWYIQFAIPDNFTFWQLTLISLGTLAVLFRRKPGQVLLLVLTAILFVGTCCNTRHWPRWLIPILPLFYMLFSEGLLTCYTGLNMGIKRIGALLSPRFKGAAALEWISSRVMSVCLILTFLTVEYRYALGACAYDLQKTHYSTSCDMYDWILHNIPKGTPICFVGVWEWPRKEEYHVRDVVWGPEYFDQYNGGKYQSPWELYRMGYKHFIMRDSYFFLYRDNPQRYPREFRFYNELLDHSRVVKEITPATYTCFGGLIHAMQRDSPMKLLEFGPQFTKKPEAEPADKG